MKTDETIYIVERRSNRKDYPTIEEHNCYIGSTIYMCIAWMINNKNSFEHENYWWWTICTTRIESPDQNTSTNRHFDWDGKELMEEPLGMELLFTHDFSKVKNGDSLYLRDGRKYLITDLAKTPTGFIIWSDAKMLKDFKYKNKNISDTPKYARLVPNIELH